MKKQSYYFALKVHLIKAMVFPVVMYVCESWAIKKAEHPRIDAFELWCWRGLLTVPWTARRSNKSILKEISAEYSLEGLMLKLQYFGHLMLRANSLEKILMAGKDWRQEEKETTEDEMIGWHHRLDGHEFEQAPGVGDGRGSLACDSPWGLRELDMTKQLNWTDWFSIHIIIYVHIFSIYLKLCAYILHICNYTHTQIGHKYLTWQSELKMDVRFWRVRTSWNLQAQFCWTDWNSLPLTFVQGCPIEFRALCPTFKLIHIYVFMYLAQKSKEPMADMGNGGAVRGPGSVPTKDWHLQISNSQHLCELQKCQTFFFLPYLTQHLSWGCPQQQHEEKQIVGNAIQPSQVDRLESHQSSLI